jgi:tetratricopeptide (TPR) repeat protein
MDTEKTIQQAIQAARAGKSDESRRLLSGVVGSEPKNARAWYLLSQVIGERDKAIECLKKVLEIDQNNRQAQERLEKLKEQPQFEELEIETPKAQPINLQPVDPIQKASNNALMFGLSLYTWGSVLIIFSVLLVIGFCFYIGFTG